MKPSVPHPLWLFAAAVALVVVAVGLRIGVPAYRQWSAIIEIQQYGYVTDVRRVGPQWLRGFVGENRMSAFDEIESIGFHCDHTRLERLYDNFEGAMWKGRVVTDAGLATLKKLPRLKGLNLSATNVSDAGMEQVACLQALEELDISGTDVSDDGVALLKRLTRLKRLSLRESRVTDAGVAELQRVLPNLEIER